MNYYRIILMFILLVGNINMANAQADSTKLKMDNSKTGQITPVKENKWSKKYKIIHNGHRQKENVTTGGMIFDLGFANWIDNTNYANATSDQYLISRPGQAMINSNDLKLRTSKSSNFNIWFFMQRLNLIRNYVNLKYGFGIELNNYRFTAPLTLKKGGANPYLPVSSIPHPYILQDSISFKKNKLATDYLTIPVMVNLRTNPDHPSKDVGISGGISIGYLYNSRNKQVSSDRGKHKNHGDYDLRPFKFSYVGELGFGDFRVYGSYAAKSIFTSDLNMMPYTVGIRLNGL